MSREICFICSEHAVDEWSHSWPGNLVRTRSTENITNNVFQTFLFDSEPIVLNVSNAIKYLRTVPIRGRILVMSKTEIPQIWVIQYFWVLSLFIVYAIMTYILVLHYFYWWCYFVFCNLILIIRNEFYYNDHFDCFTITLQVLMHFEM